MLILTYASLDEATEAWPGAKQVWVCVFAPPAGSLPTQLITRARTASAAPDAHMSIADGSRTQIRHGQFWNGAMYIKIRLYYVAR